MASLRIGSDDLAKYPFLSEAGAYIRQSGFGWEELERPEMSETVEKAASRVEAACDGRIDRVLDKFEREVLTFLVSLILVKSIGVDSIAKKFALAEARRAEGYLVADMRNSTEEQKLLLFTKIFDDLFKLKISFDSYSSLFKVDIVDYLARASHFHEPEWKLVNRPLSQGMVLLDADEAARIVRSELAELILERIKAMEVSSVPASITSLSNSLRARLAPRFEYSHAPVKAYPPCIKHATEAMDKGENLSHSARLLLATYLLAIGRSTDEIVSVFKNAPDFNEKITRYQVEHLAGLKGSRTKYSVPSCDKIRTEDLCFATADCAGISNPVQFGRKLRS